MIVPARVPPAFRTWPLERESLRAAGVVAGQDVDGVERAADARPRVGGERRGQQFDRDLVLPHGVGLRRDIVVRLRDEVGAIGPAPDGSGRAGVAAAVGVEERLDRPGGRT